MKRILVTGANGFVGQALCSALSQNGFWVRGTIRFQSQDIFNAEIRETIDVVSVGDIGGRTNWMAALEGIDTVVHLAGKAHAVYESAYNKKDVEALRDEYFRVNTAGTEQLARSAAKAGIRRIIYMSTAKVNGEETNEVPFSEEDTPHPQGYYAVSKWEAELSLRKISGETGLEVVILRIPLVYGPGVKANFLRLMKYIKNGIPLPLGSVRNLRSLIYIGNLVDAIVKCIKHPFEANKTFLVSDGEDLSTPELIRRLSEALDKPARLIPFPQSLLSLVFKLAGKSDDMERLTGSLVINSAKIRNELNWSPPYSVGQGLMKTAEWYKANEKNI